jgi:single-stranded DNA-binding protein
MDTPNDGVHLAHPPCPPPTSWTSKTPKRPAHITLSKGSRVVVVGRLQQRAWTAEDGSTRSVVEIVAEELGLSVRWATATVTVTRATRSQSE